MQTFIMTNGVNKYKWGESDMQIITVGINVALGASIKHG